MNLYSNSGKLWMFYYIKLFLKSPLFTLHPSLYSTSKFI
uniref:Uncharacterized protein n=1 Tax=Rhizophora mucronata TaxID=61149 RepID=A0A2P2PXQ4_RHIMU